MTVAYCFRSGVIELAPTMADVPEGAVPIAQGEDKTLRRRVTDKARHAYDGETLLVPGIPEAESEKDAYAALRNWRKWAFPDDETPLVPVEGAD